MKKITLALSLICISLISFAQTKWNEGTIFYNVEWQLSGQMRQMAAMLPSEMITYFKGDSVSTISKSQMSSTTFISNNKTSYQRMLLDVPMMGKKYSINFTPADQENMKDSWPEFTLTPTTENKTILNYKAQKYILTDKKTGQVSEAWFTKDIEAPQNSLTHFFEPSYGFPLQFSSMLNGLTIKASVKDLKSGAVPANHLAT